MSENSRTQIGRILLLLGRLTLAGIFLLAAYAKLKPQPGDPWSAGSIKTSLTMFGMQVDSYELLPASGVNFVSHTLPFFELFLGLWLLSGIALRLSSLASTLLLGGFYATLIRTYMKGLEINCGCFGPGERLTLGRLGLEGLMIVLTLAVTIGAFMLARRKPGSAASPASSPELQQAR